MESTIEQLTKVDFLDIYDEIAEIPITNEQVIKMCITMPCKVDLRKVNLVYLVEKKHKHKLSTYKKSKILKWLNVNLPHYLPNPEAKYLRWHERHQRKEKIEWIKRKAKAIQELPGPINESQIFEKVHVDEETSGRAGGLGADSLVNKTQDSVTSPQFNSTAGTMETVIPSQPKSTEQILPGFLGLLNASATTTESYELPSLLNIVSSTQGNDVEPMQPVVGNKSTDESNEKLLPTVDARKILFLQSEEFSSQDAFTSFNLENMVTSTQEFG